MKPRPGRLVLLGYPLGHSLSPTFQNAALRAAGIPLEYEPVAVPPDGLGAVLRELRVQGAAGNVTIPHKEAVATACDRLTPLAAAAGAVNTFWMEQGVLVGDNTDALGFDFAVERLLGRRPRDATVGVLGGGGAAAAVLAAVAGWPGSRVVLVARNTDRAERLAARFVDVAMVGDLDAMARQADLVVNATPIGLADDAMPMDPALLRDSAAVIDLVYRPGETAWVRAARARGLLAIDGLPMLVEQGALAFERWFGVAPDRRAMWRSLAQDR